MQYNKGDVVLIAPDANELSGEFNKAIIIQADWFNIGQPPSYIVCQLSPQIYLELDFRPVIKANEKNNLMCSHQVIIDKLKTLSLSQIIKTIGKLDNENLIQINGCIKAVLDL